MSRYLGLPDSVYASQNAFLSAGIMNGYATGAIGAGELCMLHESGAIMRVDPNLPWSAINQSNPYPNQILSTTKWVNVPFTGGTVVKTIGPHVRLLNRNYVVPCQSSSGVGFMLRTSAGLEMSNYINVAADVSTCVPYCHPFDNGNHAIIWHVGASLKMAIYDGYGTLVASTITISTTVLISGMVQWHGHCGLKNGNLALSWTTTGGALVGMVYGPTGSVVVNLFTIDAATTGQGHCCAPCDNGDWVHGCWDASHTRHALYRVSSAGSVVWGPVCRSGATSPHSFPDQARQHAQHNRICELKGPGSNPHIVWMIPNSAGYCNPHVHNHLGALVKAVDIGNMYHNVGCQDPVTMTPYGFFTAHAPSTGTSTFVSYFDWYGTPIGQNHGIDDGGHQFPQGTTPNMTFYTGWAGSSVAICRYAGGPSYGGAEHRMIHCDPQGFVIGTPFNPLPFGADDICTPHPDCDWDGTCHDIFFTSATLEVTSTLVKVGRSAVIGVAQAAAGNGDPVTINAQGYFQLPSTQVFGPGNAFDMRDLPLLGCRGTVGGSIAVLGGWSL